MVESADIDSGFDGRMRQLDSLLEEVDSIADPVAQAKTARILQAVLDFHGEGLRRWVGRLIVAGEPGRALLAEMSGDDVIGALLLLYGLHPQDLETRVRAALETTRPYLASHGGNVELLEVTADGVVRLKMQGSCKSCPSSSVTMKLNVERAILEKAPDVTAVEVEGAESAPLPENGGLIPVDRLLSNFRAAQNQQGALS